MVVAKSMFPTSSTGARLLATDGRELPLRAVRLTAEACAGIARVVLRQTFKNENAERLAVRYVLPLPADGAVSGYRFLLDGQEIIGEIDRRGAARERFEQAILSGRTAALLEEDRADLFTQEIGNLPPHAELTAELTIDQPLIWLEEGSWEWRFPTVVGPRFMSGPGVVADAEKITVDVASSPIAARLQLQLRIADAAMRRPDSPSHGLKIAEHGGELCVELEAREGMRLDRDLVVRWGVAKREVGVSFDVSRPAAPELSGKTYALLTLCPPVLEVNAPVLSRDLIFLIDTSGSMDGMPLIQAKRVVSLMIETLGEVDRLEMIEFGSSPKRFSKGPVAMTTDGKRAALKWLKNLSANGGTEMLAALTEALRPLRRDAQRQIVLITDGYVGFEQKIVAQILEQMPDSCRLHTLGVGSAVNRTLTRGAARAGAGMELVLGLTEDAERGAQQMIERTAGPVVTELEISIDGGHRIAPRRCPDLFARSPAKIALELSPEVRTIHVRGKTRNGIWETTAEVPALALGEGRQAIAALYAREAVEDQETLLAAGGDLREINPEIERLGLNHQIATRLTSWVAITEQQTVDPRTGLKRTVMPHEVPFGTSMESFGLRGGEQLIAASAMPDSFDGAMAMSAPKISAEGAMRVGVPMSGAGGILRGSKVPEPKAAERMPLPASLSLEPRKKRSGAPEWVGALMLLFIILALLYWWFA
jgi:Ca-activated chloride channel family protein